jgi:tripartite-type tricarboxylate transporter receptor subunit TctC
LRRWRRAPDIAPEMRAGISVRANSDPNSEERKMMKPSRFSWIFAALAAMFPAYAGAQAFPTKPIRIIVAFPPGGGTDIVTRLIASKLGGALGQQVVVENRAGADGILGTDLVAKAAPDGYTLFVGTAGNLAINQTLYSKVPFDIVKDFSALTQVVTVDMMLTVHPSLPVKTVKELVALAKAKKGDLNYGSTGIGGIPHLAMELFNYTAGTKMAHIPYKGGAPALSDLLGGHIPMMVQSMVQGLPSIKNGKLRAIALLGSKRAALLPDVPTASESLPDCVASNWYGLVAPVNTPAAIQKRIYDEFVKVVRSPEMKDLIVAQGAEPVGSTPEEFSVFLKAEIAKWARIIKTANVRAD